MSDEKPTKKRWVDEHPKGSIILIAAVFYIILFGMCAFVFAAIYIRLL